MTRHHGPKRSLGAVSALIAGLCLAPAPPAGAAPSTAGGAISLPATALPATALPAALSPALDPVLTALPKGGLTRVVVTLRDRADLASLASLDGPARASAVIRLLQSEAATSQAPLLARLSDLARTGEVGSPTSLWVTNAISVTVTASAVREIAARPDVASVVPDAITVVPSAAAAEPNIAAVGAPELWAAGQTGQGVVVATLDTGVDLANADLSARWRGGSNSWYDPYGQHPTTPVDLSGHGTATTGVIVGADGSGTSIGMAPGATWIAARIFDDRGSASATALHQAFQWVLDPDHDPATADAPDVVNGSWSLGAGPACDLSFQPDVQALRAAEILPVFAAGNFGPGSSTSVSPANYAESFAVGAVDATDAIWPSTSAGPSTCGGRSRVFPDLVAPGVSVLAADRYGGYQYVSGTSIAAPHVAGALALLLGAHPGLTGATAEAALTSTGHDFGTTGPDDRYGYGRLDVAAANQWVGAQPDLALALSPAAATIVAGGSAAYTVQVTSINGFEGDVTLALSGLESTQATWSFAPSVVTGSGTSRLEVVTPSSITPASYALTVTATSGAITRTATASLHVAAPPDFALSASPASISVKRGSKATYVITASALSGFSGQVNLSVAGLPAKTPSSWTANPVVVPGSSSLIVSTTSSTKRGTYTVVVTGTSGALTHQISVILQVT